MKIYTLIILYLITSLAFSAIKDKPTVMLKLNGKNVKLNEDSKLVIRMGVEEILTEKGYILISEEAQSMALEQMSKDSKNECLDDTCLIDAGGMLAAKGVFSVEVVKIGKTYAFKVKYLDMETAAVLRTKSLMYVGKLNNGTTLLPFSKKITREIFKTTTQATSSLTSKTKTSSIIAKDKLVVKNIDITKGKTPKEIFQIAMKYQNQKDYKNANLMFGKSCPSYNISCDFLGYNYELGFGFSNKNNSSALYYYRKGCNNKSGYSCDRMGWFYELGKSVSKNMRQAIVNYKKSCDLNYGMGCYNLSLVYFHGKGGVTKNRFTGKALAGKACKLGYKPACKYK